MTLSSGAAVHMTRISRRFGSVAAAAKPKALRPLRDFHGLGSSHVPMSTFGVGPRHQEKPAQGRGDGSAYRDSLSARLQEAAEDGVRLTPSPSCYREDARPGEGDKAVHRTVMGWWPRYVYGANPSDPNNYMVSMFLEREGIDPLRLTKREHNDMRKFWLTEQVYWGRSIPHRKQLRSLGGNMFEVPVLPVWEAAQAQAQAGGSDISGDKRRPPRRIGGGPPSEAGSDWVFYATPREYEAWEGVRKEWGHVLGKLRKLYPLW